MAALIDIDVETGWEYSYVQVNSTATRKLVALLNDLGVDGWQLVTMDDVDRTLGMNSLTAVVRRPIDPLAPPGSGDEGWYPDPAGRFDRRFWNGRAWTFSVARDADQTTHRDPPTTRPPTPGLTQ